MQENRSHAYEPQGRAALPRSPRSAIVAAQQRRPTGTFMGRENLQDLDANRGDEPTPSPLPGGELATGAANETPLLGGAGGGFMVAMHVEENVEVPVVGAQVSNLPGFGQSNLAGWTPALLPKKDTI